MMQYCLQDLDKPDASSKLQTLITKEELLRLSIYLYQYGRRDIGFFFPVKKKKIITKVIERERSQVILRNFMQINVNMR